MSSGGVGMMSSIPAPLGMAPSRKRRARVEKNPQALGESTKSRWRHAICRASVRPVAVKVVAGIPSISIDL
jgi:hypothetical protein